MLKSYIFKTIVIGLCTLVLFTSCWASPAPPEATPSAIGVPISTFTATPPARSTPTQVVASVATARATETVTSKDETQVPAPKPVETDRQSNPIVDENLATGSSDWDMGRTGFTLANDVDKQIKGYASATSVNKGGSIDFHISTHLVQTYTVDIFRAGWYQGLGGRLMQHIGPLDGYPQANCPLQTRTGLIECAWTVSYRLAIPQLWMDGIYIALLTNSENQQNYITFVVRDDQRQADFMFQQSVTTYQAYNNYPNDGVSSKSLYEYNSLGADTMAGSKRAVKVSFDRPYQDSGIGQLLSWEINFVRWLEMMGYDVTYSTNFDTHQNGKRLLDMKAFLSVGHDEYWSRPMREAAERARDAGVNLGFFGADAIYWQVRFEPSSAGVPDRIMICYKSVDLDPTTDPQLTTYYWREPPINAPEQSLIGVQYVAALTGTETLPYVVANSAHWVYAGTGLRDGDVIPGLVGYEADQFFASAPQPQGTEHALLAASPITNSVDDVHWHNASIYRAPSGAWVFATGTIAWSWGLDDYGQRGFADSRIQQATANVLKAFLTGQVPESSASIVTVATLLPPDEANPQVIETPTNTTDATLPQFTPTPEIALLPTPATTPIPYRPLIMSEIGLAQFWEFDEPAGRTTTDAKQGLVGSYQSGAIAGAQGRIQSAARFDGKTGSIYVPAMPEVTDFTIEGWSYLTVDADVNVNGNNTLYGATRKSRLLIRPGGGTYAAYAGVSLDGVEYAIQPRILESNLNKWVHWAMTRAGAVLSLYRNGALIGQRTDLPPASKASLSGTIGVERGSQTYYFNGSVDNVALYTVALSQNQISEHYRSGSNADSINQTR